MIVKKREIWGICMLINNKVRLLSILLCLALIFSLIFVTPQTIFATSTTYYVDSVSGNDSNNGLSSSTPWKTLSKVNSTTFSPGDRIMLRAGSTWTGEQLSPKGSGSSGSPIIIDKYGTGNKPLIACNGAYLYAVYFYNQQYWEVNNLEVTNLGATPLSHRTGIKFEAADIGVANHLYLKNVDVHDVNGDSVVKDKDNGGIFFVVSGNSVRTKFNDILIEGCTVKNVNRSGITVGGSSWGTLYDGYGGKYPQSLIDQCSHTNVVIRNNYVENAGGDAICTEFCKAALVEYNVANSCNTTSAAANQYSAGIWPWRNDDTIFQYNEVYGTKFNGDGEAFDCDWSNRTIYQYNYSHDNEGGFMLMCQDESLDSIVRYNISQNDKAGIFSPSGKASGVVHNNTIYIGSGLNTTPFRFTGTGNVVMTNNIFYNLGTSKNVTWQSSVTYSNNCYYGYNNYPTDNNKITSNPNFVNPGSGGIGLNTVSGYQLQANSPCIDAGKALLNNGGKDYWGNSLYYGNNADIGAHEYPAGPIFSDPKLSNLIMNSGLETGSKTSWTGWGTWAVVNSGQYAGSYCAKINPNAAAEQIISGLLPNSTYTLSAWVKTESSTSNVHLGVKEYGGAETRVSTNSTTYVQKSVTFTTGPNNTSARIYLHRDTSGSGYAYGDGFDLRYVGTYNYIVNAGLEAGDKTGWTGWGTWAIANSSQYAGSYCAKLNASSAAEQIVQGLSPNTTYTLKAKVKTDSASSNVFLGVKEFGGAEINVSASGTTYLEKTVSFTTGPNSTSARIYLYRDTSGSGYGYGDSFELN